MNTFFHLPVTLFALGALAGASAPAAWANDAAPNADMRSISVAAQGDARSNWTLQTTLALPFGERAWIILGGGQSRSGQDAVAHRPTVFAGTLGYTGTGWRASLNVTHRTDGSAHRQSDWVGSVEWQGDRFDVGLDGSMRNARQEAAVSTPDGQGGTASVPVTQTVKGGGLGLRAGAKFGDDIRLYAGYTRYHYQVARQQNGASSSSIDLIGDLVGNRTLLARTLSTRESAVNRDEAVLSSSVQLGTTYRFERVALTVEYTGDQVQDAPGTVHTALLKAAVAVGPHWTVAPAVGRTHSETYGGVNFAALSASYVW
jgi:hypothetical protein